MFTNSLAKRPLLLADSEFGKRIVFYRGISAHFCRSNPFAHPLVKKERKLMSAISINCAGHHPLKEEKTSLPITRI